MKFTHDILVLSAVVTCLCSFLTVSAEMPYAQLLHDARASAEQMVSWRRQLHQMPELGFEEFQTSAFIQEQLRDLGIPFETPIGVTGIRAMIGGNATASPASPDDTSAPTIALRSDMDGLPMEEDTGLPYASTTRGRMHACGHDTHMAMLLGAAKLLQARASSPGGLPGGGRVVLLFQPAEEGRGGAAAMVAAGVLRGVEAAHGLHVWPGLPAGTIGTRRGTMMAASDRFSLRVLGVGGHGALPHTARDPVVAAAAVVMALQTIVSRETSPVDAAVVTVSRFNTGPGAANVIPDSVELQGTIRALNTPTFERLRARLEQVAAGVAASYGCSTTNMTWSEVPYPPTQNDPAMSQLVADVGAQLAAADGGVQVAADIEPCMAAEDFAFYGRQVPSAFTFLGIADEAKGTTTGLHNPRFLMDEDQLPLGAALHAAVALEYLQRRADGAKAGEVAGATAAAAAAGGTAPAPAGTRDEL